MLQTYISKVKDELDAEDAMASRFARKVLTLNGDIQDAIDHWEAYSLTEEVDLEENTIDNFFDKMKYKFKKRALKITTAKPLPKKNAMDIDTEAGQPVKTNSTPSRTPPTLSSSPATIKKAAIPSSRTKPKIKEIHTLNANLPKPTSDRPRFNEPVRIHTKPSSSGSWLWESPQVVAEAMKAKLLDFGEQFRLEQLAAGTIENMDDDLFDEITKPVQNESYYIGRIWDEMQGVKRKITPTTCLLEGIIEEDGVVYSDLVKLNLTETTQYKLFPGQMVVVKGTNPTGREIICTDIHTNFSSNSLQSQMEPCLPVEAEEDNKTRRGGNSLLIPVAVGPFCPKTDFGWEHAHALQEFLTQVNTLHPDAIILCGPFLPNFNTALHRATQTYDQIFSQFLQHLRQYMEEIEMLNVPIIFVPNPKDVHHIPSFPQHSYSIPPACRAFCDELNWKFVPNPSLFTIDHVSFGVSTVDGVFDLNKAQLTKNVDNRWMGLASSFIEQQSFYPLQPHSDEVFLDVSNVDNLQMTFTPNILIMPSKLKQFSHNVNDHSIFINSGVLPRSYANIHITHTDGEDILNKIRVDILHL